LKCKCSSGQIMTSTGCVGEWNVQR
jgi:hypothetical protein